MQETERRHGGGRAEVGYTAVPYFYSGQYSSVLVSWFQTHSWRMEPCSNAMFQQMS